jgi:hypothetical protein
VSVTFDSDMRSLGTYIFLIGWAVFQVVSATGVAYHPVSLDTTEDACRPRAVDDAPSTESDCCSQFYGKRTGKADIEKKDSQGDEASNCCKSHHCSRTCCQVLVWQMVDSRSIDFGIAPLPSSFGTIYNILPCAPFLGVPYPPPNTV